LKVSIANALGVNVDNIKGFAVTYTTVNRRRLGAQKQQHRQLTTYVWSTSFEVTEDLDDSSAAYTDKETFTNTITAEVFSDDFASTVLSDVGVTADSTSVAVVINTRNPSPVPTPAPSPAPTSVPTSVPSLSPTPQPSSVPSLAPTPVPTLVSCSRAIALRASHFLLRQLVFSRHYIFCLSASVCQFLSLKKKIV
jgi:hypothetical protein